jgi:hypothetical protein
MEILANYLADAILSFRTCKTFAERGMGQVSDSEFFMQIDAESNSIAILVKHIAGNLHSRWRDFLTTDGEKEDRHRDTEFELIEDTRESLMSFWETGWQTLFDAIEPLTPDDLSQKVTIRGEPHTVVEAINRQMAHYPMHIGQIIFLSKHLRSTEWKTLSVPRNSSAHFNQYLAKKQASGDMKIDPLTAIDGFSKTNEKGEPE